MNTPKSGSLFVIVAPSGAGKSSLVAELLKQDAKDLAVLKVSKTPSFFINGKPLTEFGPNQLRVQVENEIRSVYQ